MTYVCKNTILSTDILAALHVAVLGRVLALLPGLGPISLRNSRCQKGIRAATKTRSSEQAKRLGSPRDDSPKVTPWEIRVLRCRVGQSSSNGPGAVNSIATA